MSEGQDAQTGTYGKVGRDRSERERGLYDVGGPSTIVHPVRRLLIYFHGEDLSGQPFYYGKGDSTTSQSTR